MITWAWALIDFLAMLVSATDCISQSVLDRRITMRLLYMIRKGVASIDSTMLASTGLTHSGAISLLSRPSVSSTKPNSPAWAR